MKIVLIKYNAGNTCSVINSLNRLGIQPEVSDNPETILSADKIIFPGVGEASSAMNYLNKTKLSTLIPNLKQPVLGICLGMQLLCENSEEGTTKGMGVFKANVKKFTKAKKIPQIGWNKIDNINSKISKENTFMYFVHSYYVEICEHTSIKSNYFEDFSAGLEYQNFYAVQFHPEKSSESGENIIRNFLCLK